MNLDNFLIRPKRRIIEQYQEAAAWQHLDQDDLHALATEVAGLPSETDSEDEEAKRFDMLVLRLQLALLRHQPGFARSRKTPRTPRAPRTPRTQVGSFRPHLHPHRLIPTQVGRLPKIPVGRLPKILRILGGWTRHLSLS